MVFSSYTFLLAFIPLVLVGFELLRRVAGSRGMVAWLLLSSAVFYGAWNPSYLVLLGGSIVFNYGWALLLGRASGRGRTKLLLALGVGVNLGLLGYFKYAGFLVGAVSAVTGSGWDVPSIVLPLAISFFTFQQVAYLVDVYRGHSPERSLARFALFVSFFPQLIAGPIVHHGEVLPQLERMRRRRRRDRDLAVGLMMFTLGLAKKVLIADEVAPQANAMFDGVAQGDVPSFAAAWLGALAYSLQIYFDFSGYSDMAIGLGRMFGVRLPANFDSPYQARSVIEFWRRWHITLSRFLRDYLYIPLGGNRKGVARRHVNVVLTMLLGGLWHGAGWTFVVWGGLHGMYLVLNHVWRATAKPAAVSAVVGRLAMPITFIAVVVAWVFFRSASFGDAATVLGAMAGLEGFSLKMDASSGKIAAVAAGLVVAWWLPNSQQMLRPYRPVAGPRPSYDGPTRLAKIIWRPDIGSAIVLAVLGILSLIQLSRSNEFIYYQF